MHCFEPTLQPWYALSLAVFLPSCAGAAGMALCRVVFLTNHVQIDYFILGKWLESPLISAAVFLSPITAGMLSLLFLIATNLLPMVRQAHHERKIGQ